jgi:hypothetical protein
LHLLRKKGRRKYRTSLGHDGAMQVQEQHFCQVSKQYEHLSAKSLEFVRESLNLQTRLISIKDKTKAEKRKRSRLVRKTFSRSFWYSGSSARLRSTGAVACTLASGAWFSALRAGAFALLTNEMVIRSDNTFSSCFHRRGPRKEIETGHE